MESSLKILASTSLSIALVLTFAVHTGLRNHEDYHGMLLLRKKPRFVNAKNLLKIFSPDLFPQVFLNYENIIDING